MLFLDIFLLLLVDDLSTREACSICSCSGYVRTNLLRGIGDTAEAPKVGVAYPDQSLICPEYDN